MATSHYIHGGWNAICDICGFKRKNSELQERWDGFMVCRPTVHPGCFETRHPADMVRPPKGEKALPWTKPEGQLSEITPQCTIASRQGIPGFGTPGCMIPGADFGYRNP